MAQAIPIGQLTATQKALLSGAEQAENKNQPNGYAGLDAQGNLPVNGVRIRIGTSAEMSAIVLDAGELAWLTDRKLLKVGDALTAGGAFLGSDINNTQAVYINPTGTLAENAAAAIAGYQLCKSLTPNGVTLSNSNEAWLVLGVGAYDFTSSMNWAIDTSYVNISGVINNYAATTLRSSDTTGTNAIMAVGHVQCRIINLGFASLLTRCINLTPGTFELRTFENLDLVGIVQPTVAVTAASYNQITFRKITSSTSLCGGIDGAVGQANVLFEDCIGNALSYFGGATAAGAGQFSGTIRRCLQNGSTWNLNLNGVLDGVRSKGPVTRLGSSARVWNSIFSNASGSAAALQNNSSAVTIKAAGNICSASLLGTNVTNGITAHNTESAGTNLW